MRIAEPLILMVRVMPKPEILVEASQLLHSMMKESRRDKGCESLELICSENDNSEWYVLERWASRELWESHATSERNITDGKKLEQLLISPLTIHFFLKK